MVNQPTISQEFLTVITGWKYMTFFSPECAIKITPAKNKMTKKWAWKEKNSLHQLIIRRCLFKSAWWIRNNRWRYFSPTANRKAAPAAYYNRRGQRAATEMRRAKRNVLFLSQVKKDFRTQQWNAIIFSCPWVTFVSLGTFGLFILFTTYIFSRHALKEQKWKVKVRQKSIFCFLVCV